MSIRHIRNFCIVAHIDHGKSTLADRLLQLTETIADREMQDQVLDSMDLERERGVTIKASAVRMAYRAEDGETYQLNLIDTPGHVDFGYEVGRALVACEGALLVVDASQGIEAQTLANLYLALEADLEIVPVVNKIDLPAARVDEAVEEIHQLLGTPRDEILRISAKEGTNAKQLLEAVVARIPPPEGSPEAPLRALIFDSHYDSYKGVVAYLRLFDGQLGAETPLFLMGSEAQANPHEVGVFSPDLRPTAQLQAGEVGYVATGLKSVRECRVGDTITGADRRAEEPLPGYRTPTPMVFAAFYPVEGEEYQDLKEALEKLQLNDASLSYTPENSEALGFGYRVGFLGMFHMDIVQERLEREYDINLIATAPSVQYEVVTHGGDLSRVHSPAQLPPRGEIGAIREPWVRAQIFTPDDYYGPTMELVTQRRGVFIQQQYPSPHRVIIDFDVPLSELIVDFYDALKSATRGYASLDYHFVDYREQDLVKLEILVNKEPVDALAMIVHRETAERKGRALVSRLKELIPRQIFTVPIQAAADGRVFAREDVPALRKDVLSKCYGGDVTRKRKLLEQQKKGKKRLKRVGSVDIPQDAFLAVLRLEEPSGS